MKKFISITLLCLLLSANGFSQNYWWNQTTAYEIFVRSFYDSNGDGIGDFKGMTQKLDYLNDGNAATKTDLGINLVWLMPINSSPSYHGYDVTNYMEVNPQYGTKADFTNMLTQAHNRGIKVIIDLVMNHTSDKHPWFIKSAANDSFYRNFYVWNPSPPAQTGPWGQQVWYNKNGSKYYGLFWSGMPDLNYNYQPVKDSMFAAAKYWIKEMGIDGFRLDAAMYLYEEGSTLKNHPKTIAFWKELNDSCKSWNSNSLLLGEVWDSPESTALYKNKLDMCFDFNLAFSNIFAIQQGTTPKLIKDIETSKTTFNPNQFASFLSNHDQTRLIESFSGNLDHNKAAASLLLTQQGVPFIYYGEEVAMKGLKPDEDLRRPMQWTAGSNSGFTTGTPWRNLNSNYGTFNVATLQADENSIWQHYQKLIEIRNNQPALQMGTHKNINNSDNQIISYQRTLNGKDVIVMINTTSLSFNNVQTIVNKSDGISGTYQMIDKFNDSTFTQEPLAAGSLNYTLGLPFKAYQTRILEFGFPVGLLEENWVSNIQMYPNPSRNEVTIKMANNPKNVWVELYAMDGKMVYQQEQLWQVMSHKFDLPNGIYFVKIKHPNGSSLNQKLVIEN